MKPLIALVAVDFATASEEAVERALELATLHVVAEVHVVSVQELTLELAFGAAERASSVAALTELVTRAAARFCAKHQLGCGARVAVHVLAGEPAAEIVALAAELDADLIVVGTHGRRGVARALLGSVAEKIVRTAGCPVLVTRPKDHADALRLPELAPRCAECGATRETSGGREAWCSHHNRSHEQTSGDASAPTPRKEVA